MKGLLHSKLFRQKLIKWVFMYIAVIGLATTVITYSRYMSKLQGTTKASPAKFNVKILKDGMVCNENNETCNLNYNGLRPREVITYTFSLDTTELEVSADLFTRIGVDSNFEIIRVVETAGSGSRTIYSKDGVLTSDTSYHENTGTNNQSTAKYNSIVVDHDVKISDTSRPITYTYEVDIQYTGGGQTNSDGDYVFSQVNPNISKAIQVGFSAIQKD